MPGFTERMRAALRRFREEADGIMAVEFSMIAPVMIAMLFGMIELTDAILAKRRVGMAASMLGDLITNRADDWVHQDEVTNILNVSGRVLEPYGISEVTVRITAVTWDDTAKEPIIVWSKERQPNGTVQNNPAPGYSVGDTFARIADQKYQVGNEALVNEDQHVIVAEMIYPFTSSLSNIVFDNFTINIQELRTPRRQSILRFCDDTSCVGTPTAVAWNTSKCLPQDEVDAGTEERC